MAIYNKSIFTVEQIPGRMLFVGCDSAEMLEKMINEDEGVESLTRSDSKFAEGDIPVKFTSIEPITELPYPSSMARSPCSRCGEGSLRYWL